MKSSIQLKIKTKKKLEMWSSKTRKRALILCRALKSFICRCTTEVLKNVHVTCIIIYFYEVKFENKLARIIMKILQTNLARKKEKKKKSTYST